jgi:hypothetical protein
MRTFGRLAVAVLSIVVGLVVAGPARAQLAPPANSDAGDNHATTNQGGSIKSGGSIGGQVSGVVANGRTSVDAKNVSKDSSVDSGEVKGSNVSHSFTGLQAAGAQGTAKNTQTGDNRFTLTQTGNATSGDGVSGQVIGAVTGAGGSASIVASNTSENNDVETGKSTFENASDAFVGLDAVTSSVGGGAAVAVNNQTGDNRLSLSQVGSSATGNGVAGQIIGVVSDGATSVDAANTSSNNDVDTVFTDSANGSEAFVGLRAEPIAQGSVATAVATNNQTGDNRASINQFAPGTSNGSTAFVGLDASPVAANVPASPAARATATNTQDGDNAFLLDQTAPVSTANVDSVAGQVVGAVTDAGGSASIVAANVSDDNSVHNVGVAGQVVGAVTAGIASIDANNTSKGNDVIGGVTAGSNSSEAFVGLDADAGAANVAAPTQGAAINTQIGDNRGTISQSASVTGGEPVAGQIIGDVTGAGGSSSIVAANTSSDNLVETGNADATNSAFAFAGLDADARAPINTPLSTASNTQTGDNRFTVSDLASATSGNGIAGQIVGVVSAGRTSVDASNTSTSNDVETGAAATTNTSDVTAGLRAITQDEAGSNLQEGDNRKSLAQAADATSGDAIAGQVTGVVTSAGGSSSVVVANRSDNIDATTGKSIFDNVDHEFVGLNFTNGPLNIF